MSACTNDSLIDYPTAPVAGICIATASAFISSLSAILLWYLFIQGNTICNLPTTSRKLFFYLTIADFFTASGNFVGLLRYAIVYLFNKDNVDNFMPCEVDYVCVAQSFITTTSSLSSFLWTGVIAVYYLFRIVWQNHEEGIRKIEEMLGFFHSIAFGMPLLIITFALSLGALGEDVPRTSGGWCWISGCDSWTEKQRLALHLLTGKLWEILVYIFMVSISIIIKAKIYLNNRRRTFTLEPLFMVNSGSNSTDSNSSLANQDESPTESLFFVMPWFLALLRLPGTIRFFIAIILNSYCNYGILYVDRILLYCQGIGDSSQATINLLLLIKYSQPARTFLKEKFTRKSVFIPN